MFIHLPKTFLTIYQQSLLEKMMEMYDIKGRVLTLLESCLTNCEESVKINKNLTKYCGVPPGRILGPSLFSMYIIYNNYYLLC